MGGRVCIEAMFWTIWKTRNELIFKNVRMTEDMINHFVKYHSFSWGLANNLVYQSQQNIWYHHPSSVLKSNIRLPKKKIIAYWSEIATLIGFIDGAWKREPSGHIKVGI